MALKGLKVLEFAGLAPGPFCGMLLTDFGACVTRIDKTPHNSIDVLQGGKRTLALDLKKPKAIEIVRSLCRKSDVLIEPFRPGVMEKLGLGPSELMRENPRLIYARLTGFGQNGAHAARAGHDINYVALSGILSLLGRKDERPTAPINLAADFAGGGLLCAFGILAAVLERHNSGKGQVVDHAMVEGAAYVGSWLIRSQKLPIWGRPRGENMLDTGVHFYDTFQTKDGKFMSVGAIEPQFYKELLEGLDLQMELPQYEDVEKSKHLFEAIFLTKTRDEWTKIFQDRDACVFPVLDMDEAYKYPHNREREVFLDKVKTNDELVPTPAPKLSRTPAQSGALAPEKDELQTVEEILNEVGSATVIAFCLFATNKIAQRSG
ncbi:alpha methylacyl-coa racemase [Culex quinquefasciatus]|uniref:Alpha methylacyl-coa racemase n=1 Tax=Culex quinquefasciatus TaxID=7176 RepID=B0WCR2_CULQU|nr:alpha methylacyl-coa racemase [Culex quinquefasciatus]|eukprot:XP_001846496.1 alpha methylacyl-coa racemase [Culex quinquefasciatus]